MTEKLDQEGHPSMPAIHDHPLSSIHAITLPMTAIHDEEKGMGIQLPSVKVREVGPAWKPRLCQSVRQVPKNHFGQLKKGAFTLKEVLN